MQLWETTGSCCKARQVCSRTAAQIRGCTWKFKALSGKMIQTNKTRSCDRPAYCDTPIANTLWLLAPFKVTVALDFMFALQSTFLGLFRLRYIDIFFLFKLFLITMVLVTEYRKHITLFVTLWHLLCLQLSFYILSVSHRQSLPSTYLK